MKSVCFKTSLLAFWLKQSVVSFDSNSVKIKRPNLLFYIVPAGEINESVPVSQIASVSSAFAVSAGGVAGGIFLACLPLLFLIMLASGEFGDISKIMSASLFLVTIPIAVIGIMLILNSLRINVRIATTSGASKWISVMTLEKQKAVEIEGIVNSLISGRMDDTNTRIQNEVLMADNKKNTDKIISGIANAIKEHTKTKG